MGELFVSSGEVIAAMKGRAGTGERAALDAYDVALDGRQDGGFFEGQIKKDAYLASGRPLFADDPEKGKALNRHIASLFRSKHAPEQAPARARSAFETGAAILAGLLLLPFAIFAGCGDDRDEHECVNPRGPCPSGPLVCWDDDDGEEQCGCQDGYREECNRYGCDCVLIRNDGSDRF